MLAELKARLRAMLAILLYGVPPMPPAPEGFDALAALVGSARSLAVQRAVEKVAKDKGLIGPTIQRDEALEWATTYEYGSQRPWTWEHAFLLEYHVGKAKGRL